MTGSLSLLERLQGLLERTYRMRSRVDDVGRFVIGDEGYRRLYGDAPVATSAGDSRTGARTLVRETPEGVRACIYYPDRMIRGLEADPPELGLRDSNVDAFATLVEELDHLLCIAERAAETRPVTLFELELHANVSKYLVLSRFLAGSLRRLRPSEREWLRRRLFEDGDYRGDDPQILGRYRDATRWALRLLGSLEGLPAERRIETLRRFHVLPSSEKVELIGRLSLG